MLFAFFIWIAEEGRSIGSERDKSAPTVWDTHIVRRWMDDFVKSHYSPNCTMVLLASVRRVTSIESSTIVKLW